MNETDPETIFARIQARRPVVDPDPLAADEAARQAEDVAVAASSAAAATAEASAAMAAEAEAAATAHAAVAGQAAPEQTAKVPPRAAAAPVGGRPHPADDRFPRSTVMRFVLDHPVSSLAVGLPLATLLLRSAASRRMIRAMLRLGAQPMVWEIARASFAAAQHFNAPPAAPIRPAGSRATGAAKKAGP